MHPSIPQLLQVQERDQRILKFQKDLKDIPLHQARAKTQLAGDAAAVEKASLTVKETEVKIKSIELDIQTRQTSIKRLQDQQFETRKNDEFAALGHEIQRYQGDVRTLEDTELEQMEALEVARAALKEAQAKLAVTQGRVDEELKALDERASGIRARLADVQADRAKLVEPADADALELYSRIFAKKPDAVVAIENGICNGCHVKVVSSTIQHVKQGTSLAQCDSCGRLVYLIE
jgi:uncharacterized protein